VKVPDKPAQNIQDARTLVSDILYNKLIAVRKSSSLSIFIIYDSLAQAFAERPIYTRGALFSQFTAVEARDILK
jgi:hypothetical protein